MALYVYVWLCYVWICRAIYDCVWLCWAMYGYVGQCRGLYVELCMAT